MNNQLLNIIIVIFFLSCENLSNKELSLYDLIPENSQIVISVKNLGKFKNSIENNNYLTSVVESNLTIKNLLLQLFRFLDQTCLYDQFYVQFASGSKEYHNLLTDHKIENPSLSNDNIGVHKLLNEHGIINIDILKSKFLFKNIK